jgi:PKD repeat protein
VSGTGPLDVSYSAASSSDSDGTIDLYEWDFGDGASDTGVSTSHIYAPGSYTATLTVTDDGGLTDTAVIDIFVNEAPTAAISANPTTGDYPLTVNFNASGSTDGDGSIVSYSWDFGDGASATGVSPSHEYTAEGSYVVTLTVTDDFGATDTDTTAINVTGPAPNEEPVAVIDASPLSGSAPLLADFDGSGSHDSDGSIVEYNWEFGDGATDTGAIVSHTYNTAGTYIARLTVVDDLGAEGTATVSITASGDGPEAVIQANVYHGVEDLTVNFNGTGSTAGGATITDFDWDFGDGGSSSAASPTHVFSAGVHWVTLTITDSLDRTGQAQTVIAVATWEEEVVRLTNIERWTADGGANLPPLKKESHIDDAALRHSTDMAVNEHFSHTGTDGSSVGDRMTDAGYIWYTCGENIAAGYTSPAAVVQGWMDSPGHHANIMYTAFREIGVSYVYDGSTYYRHWWTQDFGARTNIYPVVIEREEFATASSTVDLYIYGSGWASQMMVSNSSSFAGASWEAFASDKTWALEPGLGTKTVYVKLKSGATERTYSDSIVVVEQ